MPRNIYQASPTSPHLLSNIITGANFSDDRNGVLPLDAQMPSHSQRRRAAEMGWYIEIKISVRGRSKGKSYFSFIKDRTTVDYLRQTKGVPDFDAKKMQNAKPKPEPKYVERRAQRDYSIKAQSVKKLLEKSHKLDIPYTFSDDKEIIELIANAGKLKPSFLKMESESWKLLVRSALRGKNVLMLGDKGEGKTMACHALKNALGRPFFPFNFGNMQDAQTALIGKTHLDMKTGTYFNKSEFVKAITTPGAIILCDELSRISEDASNICFSVFDPNQRYLRLNESSTNEIIEVAEGVCFVATANIGFQYTGTHKLDAAMFDRWVKIEVDQLSKADRVAILERLFPDLTEYIVETIAEVADKIRQNYYSDDPKVTNTFSTRMCITLAELIYDGFTFMSAIEKTVYPEYSADGGNESERTVVKQIVQGKYDSRKAEYPFKSQQVKKYRIFPDGTEEEVTPN